jgi:hypothetical protein
MSGNPDGHHSPVSGSPIPSLEGLTPLPATLSLEFERKRAKQFLRQLRAADPGALRRVGAHHTVPAAVKPSDFRLAHAQFTIAREYGFASWPRLVTYFRTWQRHEHSGWRERPVRDALDEQVRSILAQHTNGRFVVAQLLATFVPRFYGRPVEEILSAPLTVDDARLLVARQARFPSWEALFEQSVSRPATLKADLYATPLGQALAPLRAGDLDGLAKLVEAHPQLLDTPLPGSFSDSLLRNALIYECRTRSPEARRITDWLAARGADLQLALNLSLTQQLRASTADIAYLLERGADPTWMPPNGISVIEHALVRYWNPEAVDLIASRVTPPDAFWVAAGLGDVRATQRCLDRKGRPTARARQHRPDFTAMGPFALPSNPEASDLEILWEAFMAAGLNHRTGTMDVLLDAGFPIDYLGWEQTMLHVAVSNAFVPVVEHLVKRGANLDLEGRHPDASARELAAAAHERDPADPAIRRIFEVCCGSA